MFSKSHYSIFAIAAAAMFTVGAANAAPSAGASAPATSTAAAAESLGDCYREAARACAAKQSYGVSCLKVEFLGCDRDHKDNYVRRPNRYDSASSVRSRLLRTAARRSSDNGGAEGGSGGGNGR